MYTPTSQVKNDKLVIEAPKMRALPPCRRGGLHKNKKAYNRRQGKNVSF